MSKKAVCIRVEISEPTQDLQTFVESLRYAGLLKVHSDMFDSSSPFFCIDILPPHGVVPEIWAEMNVARMKTFGYRVRGVSETI